MTNSFPKPQYDLPGRNSVTKTSLLGYAEDVNNAMDRIDGCYSLVESLSNGQATVATAFLIRSARCHVELFGEILDAIHKRCDESGDDIR